MEGQVSIHIFCPQKHKNKDEHRETIKFNLTEVSILKKGESFGEYALLNDRPRTATIIAKTDCIFGVLKKKIFNQILCKLNF